MDSTKIKEITLSLLNKSIDVEDVSIEDLQEVVNLLNHVDTNKQDDLNKISQLASDSELGKYEDAGANAGVIKTEMIKFDEQGQWSLDKIDYSKFNQPSVNAKSPSPDQDYRTHTNPAEKKPWEGKAERTKQVRAKIDADFAARRAAMPTDENTGGKTALQTIREKNKI